METKNLALFLLTCIIECQFSLSMPTIEPQHPPNFVVQVPHINFTFSNSKNPTTVWNNSEGTPEDYDYNYYENEFASDFDGFDNSDDNKNQYFVKIPNNQTIARNSTSQPQLEEKPFTTDENLLTDESSNSSILETTNNDIEEESVSDSDSQSDPDEIIENDESGSESESATSIPGIPGEDYPIYHTIPVTDFLCSEQRYKGFFADVDTKCQAWHYCDFQDNQKTFLCPNGTIFSQIQLTCDWWFNVHCNESQQLYVLNERLYRYIKPPTPKFPEDFHGPEVDLWLIQQYKQGLLPKTRKTSASPNTNINGNETQVN